MWWVDDRPADTLPVADRGLQYGDGLFETLAVVDGRVRHLDLHLARLQNGCRRLGFPATAWRGLRQQLTARARGQRRAVLKLIVTRGDGQRGYLPPEKPAPRRLLAQTAWPAWPAVHYTHGVALRVCRTTAGLNPVLAGMKHLNRLEQVLARSEWRSARWQEGLLLDVRQRVVGGTMSNVFARRGERLWTPKLADCGVHGVMRSVIMQRAPLLGWTVEMRDMSLDDLIASDEIFVSNALFGVWPVKRLGDARFPVGPAASALIADLKLREAAV